MENPIPPSALPPPGNPWLPGSLARLARLGTARKRTGSREAKGGKAKGGKAGGTRIERHDTRLAGVYNVGKKYVSLR